MNTKIESVASSFRDAITTVIVPLQTSRNLNPTELARLESLAEEITKLLKGSDSISKSLLNELYLTARILKNEAVHSISHRSQLEAASKKLEHYFELILKDESPQQRIPGVPRIV